MLPEISTMPFEFLRPIWLLGLIIIALLSLIGYKRNNSTKQQSLIAPHLSGNIVSRGENSSRQQFAFGLMATIACIALAGPTWRTIDMPIYEVEKAQVIVFDLSYSMYATDIKPNRLSRAKFKAIDLVKQWSEGEKALIAYSGDAFTITPLTRDGNAIINHIGNLSPDIMPVVGSRADLALDKALELLENAGYKQGHIVFISDDINQQQSEQIIDTVKDSNWVVSVLAVATEQGAPIQLPNGSLLKNDNGEIIVPKLTPKPLYDISRASNGLYLSSRNNSSDIQKLGRFYDDKQARKSESEQAGADQFAIDDGYWLSFLLLPLCLLLFRKGLFFALLLVVSLPFTSPTLEASVWKNDQQNGYQAYQNGDYQSASELYNDALDKGSALYKNKQYEQALSAFTEAVNKQPDNAAAFYNQGNSYAQLQQFDKAIEAYDKALTIDPNLQQAQQNKALLEKMKEQQEQQNNENNDQDSQQSEQQQSQDSQSEQQKSQDSQSEQQQNEQQQSQDSQSEQQDEQQQSQDSQSEQQDEQQQQSQDSQSEEEKQSQDSQSEQQQQQAQSESQSEPEDQQSEEQQAAQLTETDQAVNQELEELPNWLKNMPDDPSILLRRKMQVEYQKRSQSQPVQQQTSNGAIW